MTDREKAFVLDSVRSHVLADWLHRGPAQLEKIQNLIETKLKAVALSQGIPLELLETARVESRAFLEETRLTGEG